LGADEGTPKVDGSGACERMGGSMNNAFGVRSGAKAGLSAGLDDGLRAGFNDEWSEMGFARAQCRPQLLW
jgi:hypothetical protein